MTSISVQYNWYNAGIGFGTFFGFIAFIYTWGNSTHVI